MVIGEPALTRTDHRPWPLPDAPWVQRQTWTDLLFMHWPLDPATMRPLVPPALPLDTFEGRAWIGIVPFRMSGVTARLFPPLPWISAFPELNVRTYVTLEGKPGVFFFSLDAARLLAVVGARVAFNLPYFHALMGARWRDGFLEYRSRRKHGPPAELALRYRPVGTAFEAVPGTLDYFLTERYCLYGLDHLGRPQRLNITHPPWELQAAKAEIGRNAMAAAAGVALPDAAPLLHFARRQDMAAWLPEPARG